MASLPYLWRIESTAASRRFKRLARSAAFGTLEEKAAGSGCRFFGIGEIENAHLHRCVRRQQFPGADAEKPYRFPVPELMEQMTGGIVDRVCRVGWRKKGHRGGKMRKSRSI